MAEYNHIEIMREEAVRQYKFPPFPNAPRPPVRDRGQHGQKLKQQLETSLDEIVSKRIDIGIQSENLVVLELISNALSSELLEHMLRRFHMYLVEETDIPNSNNSRLVVQFENLSDIERFNRERELWQNDDETEAILTYAKRRDIFSCVDNIRAVMREDRIGDRLKEYFHTPTLFPEGFFIVNIDVWFNREQATAIEIERQIRQVLGTAGSRLLGDLFQIPSMLLGRALVNEFTLNALLDMDIVATVELPFSNTSAEPCELYNFDYEPVIQDDLEDDAPLAAVLDSGIFTGNPLLENVVVAEEEFDTTENTTTDMNGHGTGVAGIVVYGDFINSIQTRSFKPLVRVCNGKIMHDENGVPCFPDDKRPEQIVGEAIEYFNKEFDCRVFNLSAGDREHLYGGGRQFAWAEMLDQLARELDIVIIISAGNVVEPELEVFSTREELIKQSRDQLFMPNHRLIDPATSALGITVGSIARFDEPSVVTNRITNISAGKKDDLSVFTRIGKGVNGAIKPDVVDYGGNFAVSQPTRDRNRWVKNIGLLEPTLNNTNDKIFKGYCGTSFSAPHATHIVARIERALEKQINEKPSSNLIRAIFVNSARYSEDMIKCSEESEDPLYSGQSNPKQERKLRLYGFGRANDSLLYSDYNRVTLFTEDKLSLRSFHLYKIPVPKEFLLIKAHKTISISLAYNPITRLSRKDYLTNNLWFEVFKRIYEEDLALYKAKKEAGEDAEDDLDKLPDGNKAKDFRPGYTEINKGTLQQRIWQKGARGGSDLLWDESEPYIYVLVTGKERFKYAEQEVPQDYALAVTFSYESEEDIQLYTKLKNQVKLKTRQTERERERVRGRIR